jgi:hypothetical protein
VWARALEFVRALVWASALAYEGRTTLGACLLERMEHKGLPCDAAKGMFQRTTLEMAAWDKLRPGAHRIESVPVHFEYKMLMWPKGCSKGHR